MRKWFANFALIKNRKLLLFRFVVAKLCLWLDSAFNHQDSLKLKIQYFLLHLIAVQIK